MKRNILFLLIIAILVVCFSGLFTGCSGTEDSTSYNMKVGTWKTAQTIQPFLYDKFLNENNQIEVLSFTNPGDQKSALLAGDLDLCGTTMVTAIMAAANGEPIKIICTLCNKCSALVVGSESGIATPADLKGKTIAYVPGTMHHILLLETLEKAGLDPAKDVTLTRIDFFDMGQALSQGSIDAFLSGEPYPSIALSEGYGKILAYPYYYESIGYINGAMITTEEKINNEYDKIQSLINAHIKATEYLENNQSEWLDMAAEFGTNRDVLELAADNMELAYNISPEMITQTKNLAQLMYDLGVISQVPDIDSLFDLSFLENTKE